MSTGIEHVEIRCKTALNNISRMPYDKDLNIYRGCTHGCVYCFAQYSHRYLADENYFNRIYVKTNICEQLERQLFKARHVDYVINLGGVTDSYQPSEDTYKLMPDILALLIKYKVSVIISTKSDLILRDYDLFAELGRRAYVNIASTVTTMDEAVRKKIEPGAVSSDRRIAMLREFGNTSCFTAVHTMPIIPYITGRVSNLDALYAAAKGAGVRYLLPQVMNLRGETKTYFLNFLYKEYPEYYHKISKLYETGHIDKEYKAKIYAIVRTMQDKYKLGANYNKDFPQVQKTPYQLKQLSIEDFLAEAK